MRAPKKILGAIAGISMLATTLGIGSAAFAASPTYYDIYDLTTLAQNAANGLYAAGIMNGTAPGKFSPTGVVTRAQAVKFVVNLSGVKLEYPKTPSYSDVGTGSQYYPYIETALADGFLTGYAGSSGAFDPSTPVTRIDLAILVINAMGDQSVAQSLATNTTLYKQFTDLSKVPSGDLGYANAGMKLGFVPPLNSTLYYPNGNVDREELAVGLWRGYEALQSAEPASIKVTQSASTVGVNEADILTPAVMNKAGKALTAAQLAGYTVSFSVTGSNASDATVSSEGTFVATAAGDYTVDVSISGGVLTSPVTTTVTVGVYGTATALKVVPASSTLVADGAATDVVTVEAVDANGNVVGDYSGTANVDDSLGILVPAADQPSDVTAQTNDSTATVTLANGTGTLDIGDTALTNSTDTITATNSALTAGSATVTTVVPTATTIALSINSGSPASLSAGAQTSTLVSVAFDDAAGNAMSTGVDQYVTLTLTGPGSFVAGATPVTTITEFDGGALTVPVYSELGQPGTISVSASSASGLKSSPLAIDTYINTSAASLSVTTSTGTDANGNTYTQYTVEVLDTNGHPITSNGTGTIQVTDNAIGEGGALEFGTLNADNDYSDTYGEDELATSTGDVASVPMSNGVATFVVETATVGTGSVTLSVSGTSGLPDGLSTTSTYSYTVGAPAMVALTPGTGVSQYEVVGGASVTIQAQVEDSNGNAVTTAGNDVTFQFVSDTAGVEFPNGLATGTYTTVTGSNGIADLTLTMPSVAATGDSFELEASYGSAIAAAPNLAMTPTISVNPSTDTQFVTTQLVPSATTATETAGGTLTGLTVTAENAVGGGVGGDTLSFSSSNTNVVTAPANVTTSTSSTSLGVATFSVATGLAGSAVLTITDLSVPSQPKTEIAITVTPGTSAQQVELEYNGAPISSSNPIDVAAGTPVELSVVNADSAGDPIPVAGSEAEVVYLSVANTLTGGFLSAPGGAPISSVDINPGESSAVVYFESSTAETITTGLTASSIGVFGSGAITQAYAPLTAETIALDIPSNVDITTAGNVTVDAGGTDVTVGLTVGESQAAIISAIAAALNANTTVTGTYTVGTTSGSVTLTQKTAASGGVAFTETDTDSTGLGAITGTVTTPYSALTPEIYTLTVTGPSSAVDPATTAAAFGGTIYATFAAGTVNATVSVAITAGETPAESAAAIATALTDAVTAGTITGWSFGNTSGDNTVVATQSVAANTPVSITLTD